jgi:hypothetical protein
MQEQTPTNGRGRSLPWQDSLNVSLDAATIDAIAKRVADILATDLNGSGGQLITAGDVAHRLGVSLTPGAQ